MKKKSESGFTLVELIIVIIILGILAALAIPQFITSTGDAQLATLQSNLAVLRNQINLYYHQHGSVYAGVNDENGGAGLGGVGLNDPALIQQLTQYSSMTGDAAATLNRATHPFGPYFLNGIPDNPMNGSNGIYIFAEAAPLDAADVTTATTSPPTAGWIYSKTTGEIRSADSVANLGL